MIYSEEEKRRDLKNTYNAYLYFQRLEEIMESLVGKDKIFLYRKHCEATLKPNMMTTAAYMERIKEGYLGLGRVFPAGLSDGLHATLAPAITLMQEILKKVRMVLYPNSSKYKLNFLEEETKIVRPYTKVSTSADRTIKWVRCSTNTYLPRPVVGPTIPNHINKNNPNLNKLEKENQEKEKLEKEKQEKVKNKRRRTWRRR